MSEITIGLAANGEMVRMPTKMANRHGLIAGATGTGKTVTLRVLAEQFSQRGVPVFMADVKGDLASISQAGNLEKVQKRIEKLSLQDFNTQAFPTIFWDLYGKTGHPIRTTLSELGPILLARLLDLNDTQSSLLEMAYKIADDQGMLVLDIKDLRSLLNWMTDHASELRADYGNVSKASLGAILRSLLSLEQAGGDQFFGEPALDIKDLMKVDFSGLGVISLLDASSLIQDSRLYSTFLIWLLSELFEELEEVGDLDKPKLVFFFDEAHLLFKGASHVFLEKIEMVVRLIRSKGVGVYFVTQSPGDIPESVLGQLGNRVQHALRAFTPKDKKAVKVAADTFRPNPDFKTSDVITELGVGESLVSLLDPQGSPQVVERVLNSPPKSLLGTIEESVRQEVYQRSPIGTKYDTVIDRESAYEILKKREEQRQAEQEKNESQERVMKKKKASGSRRQGVGEAFVKSMARSAARQMGSYIVRGVLGSILRR